MTVYKLQRDILYGPVLPVFVTVQGMYVLCKTYSLFAFFGIFERKQFLI